MSIFLVFCVLALICFIVAAAKQDYGIYAQPLGLAFLTLALILSKAVA